MSRRPIAGLIAMTALLAAARLGLAAEVRASLPTGQVNPGLPFAFEIEIEGAGDYETPTLPDMPGVEVVGGPSRSTQSMTQIINGRMSRSDTVTLTWELVTRALGPGTIPAIRVKVDGAWRETRPITFVATDPKAGDLLYVEVVAANEEIYLGEPLDLTLRVWIKPYLDQMLSGPLRDDTMWSFVDEQRSSWGVFTEPLRELMGGSALIRQGPRARSMTRRDDEGRVASYYVFEVRSTTWPERAGPLQIDPVAVVMRYPTALQRSRGVFSRGQLEVADSKLIVDTAEPPSVVVREPPEAGRPAFWRGAVGRFDLAVEAKPTQVAVGDPITLTITLTDRTPRGTQLDLLAPPPLDALPELTADFRVPGTPLAGVVDGRTKTFTQTIRAMRDDVTAVPALPFAFFDPARTAYEVVRSEPIPLSVAPAMSVNMNDVVAAEGASGPQATELTEVSRGLLANATGPELLAVRTPFRPGWMQAALVVLPPLVFAFVAVGARHHRRVDGARVRRRAAGRTAAGRLRAARSAEGTARAEAVAEALRDYVADRTGAMPGTLTRADVIARLEARDVDPSLRAEVGAVLEECEAIVYAGGADGHADAIADRAAACLGRLERERRA